MGAGRILLRHRTVASPSPTTSANFLSDRRNDDDTNSKVHSVCIKENIGMLTLIQRVICKREYATFLSCCIYLLCLHRLWITIDNINSKWYFYFSLLAALFAYYNCFSLWALCVAKGRENVQHRYRALSLSAWQAELQVMLCSLLAQYALILPMMLMLCEQSKLNWLLQRVSGLSLLFCNAAQ